MQDIITRIDKINRKCSALTAQLNSTATSCSSDNISYVSCTRLFGIAVTSRSKYENESMTIKRA